MQSPKQRRGGLSPREGGGRKSVGEGRQSPWGETKSAGGGATCDGDVWPRLPTPHYHRVLAQKGLRTMIADHIKAPFSSCPHCRGMKGRDTGFPDTAFSMH